MVFRKYLFVSPVLVALLLAGCRRVVELPEMVDAHYMQYEIEYLEAKAGDIPTRILPGTMDAYYTQHYVLTKIE